MLSLYNVICMVVFKADHLVWASQVVFSSLGKTISPDLALFGFQQYFG